MDKNFYDEDYFEGRGSNYWWTVGSYEKLKAFPHWEEIMKFIQKFIDRGRLLDIGCAYGFLVREASKYFESFGIDISSFAVKKSKEYCKGKISRASTVSLPFKKESFNVITVVDTLEHVSQINLCIKEFFRILKNDGILFLQLPNPLFWSHICGRFGLEDNTHMNDFWLKQWQTVLEKSGFEIIKSVGMISVSFGKIRFLLKSGKATVLFPAWWIIAKKNFRFPEHGETR